MLLCLSIVYRVLRQVGVIGKPEVCKRALVAALLRFAEPQGIVRIDGVDVADIGTQDLRERIALVSQVRGSELRICASESRSSLR